jgi:hypothetical protein
LLVGWQLVGGDSWWVGLLAVGGGVSYECRDASTSTPPSSDSAGLAAAGPPVSSCPSSAQVVRHVWISPNSQNMERANSTIELIDRVLSSPQCYRSGWRFGKLFLSSPISLSHILFPLPSTAVVQMTETSSIFSSPPAPGHGTPKTTARSARVARCPPQCARCWTRAPDSTPPRSRPARPTAEYLHIPSVWRGSTHLHRCTHITRTHGSAVRQHTIHEHTSTQITRTHGSAVRQHTIHMSTHLHRCTHITRTHGSAVRQHTTQMPTQCPVATPQTKQQHACL